MTAQTTIVPAGTGRALGVLESKLIDIDQIQHNTGGELGFYGATPVTQRANLIQAASVVSVSSNITIAASITAWVLEVTNTLVGLGVWKGAA
jgi:hypothetical protein